MANEVASEAKKQKRLKIDLEIDHVLALQDLLSRTEPKGRSEARNHSKLFKEFNAKCRDYTNESRMEFRWKPGTVEWTDEAAIEYLIQVLEKRIDAGFAGTLSIGYSHLLEATDLYKDEYKRK